MRKFLISCSIVSALALWGCGTVDVAAVRAQIDECKQAVAVLAASVAELEAVSERTGSADAASAAAAARKALDIAQAKIPEMEASLSKLQDKEPWWKFAAAAAWPFVTPLLRLIPGPGGLIATMIGEAAFKMNASRDQRERDKRAHAALDAAEKA